MNRTTRWVLPLLVAWVGVGCAANVQSPAARDEPSAPTGAPSAPAAGAATADGAADAGTTPGVYVPPADPDVDVPPGAPQRCIDRREVRGIEAVGNHTLLFLLRDGSAWRNRLRRACVGLRRNSIFSYETQTGRLCANDIVYTLTDFVGELRRDGNCGLGEFDFLTPDQVEAIQAME